MLTKILKQLQA